MAVAFTIGSLSVARVLLGTPSREPQEYSRNMVGYGDPVGMFLLYSYYILGVPCLGFPVQSLYLSP